MRTRPAIATRRRPTLLLRGQQALLFVLLSLPGNPVAAAESTHSRTAFVSEAPVLAELVVSTKLDPLLRRLVLDQAGRRPLLWAVGSETEEPLIRTEMLGDGRLAAGVFVKTADVLATTARIEALGGYVRVEAGDIVIGVVPVVSLEELAGMAETSSIEASKYAKALLDVSRPATKADLVQAGAGLSSPRTGAGVIVGVVDSGIDYTRPDFKTSSGATRIRSIWDISGVPSGSSAPRICSEAEIDSSSCPERDLNGHGTHVTGIAVGAGRLQAGFVGMAPDADIIAAKATRSTSASGVFYTDDVVAATAYVFQRAQASGRPAVVNLSLGGIGGPLDGTSAFEQGLSNLTGAGRIIVAAAGNSGDEPVHLSYATAGSSWEDSLETPWIPGTDKSPGYVSVWYDSGSITVGIAARTSSSEDTAVISSSIAPGQATGVRDLKDGSGTVLAHYEIDASTMSYAGNGAHFVYVMLEPVVSRYFSLFTYGSGSFDAWASNMTFGTRNESYWVPGGSQKTIASPATAAKVISVGAFMTKKQWTDANGTSRSFTSWCGQSFTDTLGDIACFSSRGPTRDGRVKPDITAPGHRIASDLSVDSLSNHDVSDRMLGGKLLLESGTSQAAPHVTGIVALMLQANPSLTYNAALQALQGSAAKDSFTESAGNNTWGAGKVNALEAVKAVGSGGGSAPTASFTFSANPKAGQAVQFTDTSTGSPTAWSWNFGDNGTSTSRNPTHIFASSGSYQVSLTASNSAGSSTNTQAVVVGASSGSVCTEDAYTMCMVGGRYQVRSRWRNQYAGGMEWALFKTKLTDATGAFWIFDQGTYEYLIRFNTATNNGRVWIAIPTFTSVEFWIAVTDTKTGQFKEYHSPPGNQTMIYDPNYFVYP